MVRDIISSKTKKYIRFITTKWFEIHSIFVLYQNAVKCKTQTFVLVNLEKPLKLFQQIRDWAEERGLYESDLNPEMRTLIDLYTDSDLNSNTVDNLMRQAPTPQSSSGRTSESARPRRRWSN